MSKENDGGPAFPIQKEMLSTKIDEGHFSEIITIPGMSLRDYFAAKAMAALLCGGRDVNLPGEGSLSEIGLSKMSYLYADAMLLAKEK